jgi:hypothetical protein
LGYLWGYNSPHLQPIIKLTKVSFQQATSPPIEDLPRPTVSSF